MPASNVVASQNVIRQYRTELAASERELARRELVAAGEVAALDAALAAAARAETTLDNLNAQTAHLPVLRAELDAAVARGGDIVRELGACNAAMDRIRAELPGASFLHRARLAGRLQQLEQRAAILRLEAEVSTSRIAELRTQLPALEAIEAKLPAARTEAATARTRATQLANQAAASKQELELTRTRVRGAHTGLAHAATAYQLQLDALVASLSGEVPVLLLPVRIETRIIAADLLVRIYPDAIAEDCHQPELIPEEVRGGQEFWRTTTAGGVDAHRTAWQVLASSFGPTRAAWIAQQTESSRQPGVPSQSRWTRPSVARALPDRWMLLGYRNNARVLHQRGNPILPPLATGPTPDATTPVYPVGNTGLELDEAIHWMVDFDKALVAGMAFRVPFPAPLNQPLDLLMVLGIMAGLDEKESADELQALLEAHHYSDGLGLVRPGTPTNNTEDVPAGFTSSDPAHAISFGIERGLPLCQANDGRAGSALARALGLDASVFAHVRNADTRDGLTAGHMNRSLWPATFGYFCSQTMADMFFGRDLSDWRDYFEKYVRAAGPLPTIRTGAQPYGYLPVTSLTAWRQAPRQPELIFFHVSESARGIEVTYRIAWDLEPGGGVSAYAQKQDIPIKPGLAAALFAVTDVNRDGTPDLIAVELASGRLTTPSYTIGWNIGAGGAADWMRSTPLPELQDMASPFGIAVYDVDNNRVPDVCFFGINPDGSASFRIAWNPNIRGELGEWSDDIRVRGVFTERPATGGIALTDLNRNGRPDLLVLEASSAGASYRVGHDVDVTGRISWWSDAKPVPLPPETQHAAISVVTFSDGRKDLIVFYVGGMREQPAGFILVGAELDRGGDVTGGWLGPFAAGDGSWEATVGVGLAITEVGRAPDLDLWRSAGFVNLLERLRGIWSRSIPRISRLDPSAADPGARLIDVLAMEPVSAAFSARSANGSLYLLNLWRLMGVAIDEDTWKQNLRNAVRSILDTSGFNRNVRWTEFSYAPLSASLEGPLVRGGPPAPDGPLTPNYIEWLLKATPRELHDETYAGAAPGSLLYLLLRHALLWEFAEAAFRLQHVPERERLDPEMIDFEARTRTPWRQLLEPFAPAGGQESGAYLHGLARTNPSAPEIAGIVAMYRCLHHLAALPVSELERLMCESLDLGAARLDAWITACATERLGWIRDRKPDGIYLGGYGWVENVGKVERRDSSGFVHAPSTAHAAAAAILRSGYLARRGAQQGEVLAVDLSSERVRLALELMEGVRQGVPLGALLGYRFERGVHEDHGGVDLDKYIPVFRNLAPLTARKLTPSNEPVENVAPANVVDGLALLRRWQKGKAAVPPLWNAATIPFGTAGFPRYVDPPQNDDHRSGNREYHGIWSELEVLEIAADAVSDVLTAESVYQAVQGNYLRSGASLDALSRGEVPPPDPEVVRTPRTGVALTHRLAVLFSGGVNTTDDDLRAWHANGDWSQHPRAAAEPRLNFWAAKLLGDPSRIKYRVVYNDSATGQPVEPPRTISVFQLGLCPLDVVYMAPLMEPAPESGIGYRAARSEIEERMRIHGIQTRPGNPDPALRAGLITDRDANWTLDELSIPEVAEVARRVRESITNSRAAEARDVVPLAATSKPAFDLDDTDLRDRATAAVTGLRAANASLENLLDVSGSAEQIMAVLLIIASYATPDALPAADETPAAIRTRAERIYAEIETKLKDIDAAEQSLVRDNTNKEKQRDHDLWRLKRIFGADFRILPRFTPVAAAALKTAFDSSNSLLGGDTAAPVTWFQRVSRVRSGAARLHHALLAADAVGGDSGAFRAAQLPYKVGDRWLALDLAAGTRMAGGRVSLVALLPGENRNESFVPAQGMAGLVFDEWVEVVPNKSETTAITFHFDAPAAAPQQCLLLAAPPDPDQAWSIERLERIVLETRQLARMRLVDVDSLGETGHLLPALYFAFNIQGDTISTDFARNLEAG